MSEPTTTSAQPEHANLVARVEALEQGKVFDATQEAIQNIQMEHLKQLREIRNAMTNDSTASNSALSKELDTLKDENARLTKSNAKQAYRIQHLVQTVESLLKAKEEAK